ncbi:methyltransferase domain-containing protein [Altererythrobacter xixiisoli]|uniref:Methyltransferase domain-containing protein n=1 Tax=Croceibacterium xixiisoli TaxID=1476466 RepID=A0A6I4TVD6_9SPHN|nr:class I SAM-dependent methyltransferase [Croceibacterium xixiisoli]MXO98558.1 methyltransferase domain-containing protein [Croceibacterium xixiisoli]
MNAFLHRSCPACGEQGAPPEMRAGKMAEAMELGALRSFWAGLFKEKCFFTYHRCQTCELLYNPVFFTQDQLVELYSQMAPNMDMVSDEAIIATQRGYYQRVLRQHGGQSGGYLEIGPDVGHIVYEAAARGTFDHFYLFEPNRAIHGRLRAAASGWPVTLSAGMKDLSMVPDGSVGMAVMVHVLDHLLDPLAMLIQIRAKLRPGGSLMIVTHNEGSLLRRVMGERWPPFCLQHPELYRPQTIASLLTRAGFHNVVVERSRNVFPLDFLAKQAVWAAGLQVKNVPLPSIPIGLKLGNILTLARG